MEKENLAYWTGVVQSDGSLRNYFEKDRRVLRHLISFTVSKKSLPMLEKFRLLSNVIFERNARIFKLKSCEFWTYNIRVSKLLEEFKRLDISFGGDPPRPPFWSLSKESSFGAYLAGLIDGDGDIRVKRKRYPQCVIRITSSSKQTNLKNSVSKILNCRASITFRKREKEIENRKFIGSEYSLEFYVSKKNYKFIRENIVPHMALDYKRDKLLNFIESKWLS